MKKDETKHWSKKLATKTLLKEEKDFKLYSTDNEYVIEFCEEPEIIKEPMATTAGIDILPGNDIKKLMSKKTSAGFCNIWCSEGWAFRYLGKIKCQLVDSEEENTLVMFDVIHNNEKINKPKPSDNLFDQGMRYHYPCYIFHDDTLDEDTGKCTCDLFFSNHCGSGRIIETTIVEFWNNE